MRKGQKQSDEAKTKEELSYHYDKMIMLCKETKRACDEYLIDISEDMIKYKGEEWYLQEYGSLFGKDILKKIKGPGNPA